MIQEVTINGRKFLLSPRTVNDNLVFENMQLGGLQAAAVAIVQSVNRAADSLSYWRKPFLKWHCRRISVKWLMENLTIIEFETLSSALAKLEGLHDTGETKKKAESVTRLHAV